MKSAEKEKTISSLDELVKNMQKKYGADALSVFGKEQVVVEWVPVDSISITELLGKGIPRGRMIEVFGPESSGKTSFITYLAAQVQKHWFEDRKRYGVVALIDAEHEYDPEYAKSFGLKMEDVLFSQPDSGEQALNIVEDFVQSGLVDCILVDSVAALTPQAEIDGEMGDQQVGAQARLMSKACRKLKSLMKSDSATVIFTNQIRVKIGGYSPTGEATTTSGGNALKFWAAIRIQVKKGDWIGEASNSGGLPGIHCILKTQKNKVATPYRTADMSIMFGKGYQLDGEYVAAWTNFGFIEKSGTWFAVTNLDGTQTKIQGASAVMEYVKANPGLYEDLKKRLQAAMVTKKTIVIEAEESEENMEAVIAEQERLESEFSNTDSQGQPDLEKPAEKPVPKSRKSVKKGE